MRSTALSTLLRSRELHRIPERSFAPATFGLGALAGRLVELSARGSSAVLTVATGLVLEAQQAGEPAAWISAGSLFYPPDVAESGVDLGALVLIRPPAGLVSLLRSAERLLRSGAFGLVVLDLGHTPQLPLSAQSRLAGLAQQHDIALLCLTIKDAGAPSLGSLVSLHAVAQRQPAGPGLFRCEVRVLKDKRHGPGRMHREEGFRGPPGLR